MTVMYPRAALIVAHPGHELRLHHWMERARPIVFVLTDGSGSAGHSRVPSTMTVLRAAGASGGSVMGRFTDEELYRAIMTGEVEPIARVAEEIAAVLVAEDVELVVADACEFYNPAHDLCRAVADLAVERASAAARRPIASYDYAVVGAPDADGDTVVRLDDAAMQRKIGAAMSYPEMRHEVEIALRLDRLDAYRVEVLRRVEPAGAMPEPDGRPFYERAGEEHVAAGKYETVLRHREHFAPFVAALTASFRATLVTV